MNEVEIHNWKQHPVTKKLYNLVKQAIQLSSESIIAGSPLYAEKPEINYADVVGFIRGLNFVLEADLATEEERDDDNEVYTRWMADSNRSN